MSNVTHVVVGYDFSHSGHAALHRGVLLAARAPAHVLHVLCVIDPRSPFPSVPSYGGVDGTYAARVQEVLAMEIQHELEQSEVQGPVHFFVHVRIARHPADHILDLAQAVGADLIIVGNHGLRGLERLLVGSTSAKVVREAACSVEVARPRPYPEVEPLPVTEGDLDDHHVPPHRYTYEDRRANLRPPEWPLD